MRFLILADLSLKACNFSVLFSLFDFFSSCDTFFWWGFCKVLGFDFNDYLLFNSISCFSLSYFYNCSLNILTISSWFIRRSWRLWTICRSYYPPIRSSSWWDWTDWTDWKLAIEPKPGAILSASISGWGFSAGIPS